MTVESVSSQTLEPCRKRHKGENQTKSGKSILAKSRTTKTLQQQFTRHPLNVKPSSNVLFARDDELLKIGRSAGTLFKKLPDDVIIGILGLLDKRGLCNASLVSKFWYAYSTFDELWRNLYTTKTEEEREASGLTFKEWKGSWRSSILKIDVKEQIPIDCGGLVYSDALFTPYANSCIDYQEVFRDIIKEQENLRDIDGYWDANVLTNPSKFPYRGRIPRIEESTFTYEMFERNKWDQHPFILGSNDPIKSKNRWPGWTIKYLLEQFPNVKFRQESVLWELSLYESYALANRDENPLYLFDCRSEAMKVLLPTGYFPHPPIYATKDLFKVFQECRPDHSWLITGPQRSGSTFHKDPNSTDAWNTVLQGSKLWVLLPPGMKPPGVFVSDDESEVISPTGLAEWVKSGFWNDSIQISDEATLDTNDNFGSGGFRTCVVGITFANECMYVPSGWWHTVINLEDSVAFTANFVPPCKISNVLQFMKFKPDQVSGFRHDLLQKKLSEFINGYTGNIDENIETIKKYLQREDLRNNDEDVGELNGACQMPVFETFVEFLKASGYEDLVRESLAHLKKKSDDEEEDLKVRSRAWETLTEEGRKKNNNGFSFGFDIDE
ncbi:uncharacterized protein C5L36_0C07870 [Pichia kudriavzevii]|uniref:Bifunctional arginine demethylase and lysyl-hydroxylase psr-1 n=1 Tax=Pichia kudriavzevii TaxID=4909 RepID=A0A1V2LQP2_PICKU|nr:uncharacterized protein C5L36_0C07870 [Pichia kudriavzevii]AWU76873.1 hypothetical protein C5L36_0C07870 [Pichia kudriavzevii]ONH75924.1 Bifunctional arginine demethylase and lysyl-hydroxylase psr-1 [Pichia kudriavzevii]